VRPAELVLGPQRSKDSAPEEHASVDRRIFRPIVRAFGPNELADVFLLQMPQIDVTEAGDDTLSELSVALCRGDGDGVLRSSSVIADRSVKRQGLAGPMPGQESILGARRSIFHLIETLREALRFSAPHRH
jgi:hypothetical protein